MKRSQAKASARGFAGPGAGAGFGGGLGFGFGGGAAGQGSSLSYLTEPPSFSAVSDPNVIVFLKNLLKKDSTTKAKALEDLLAYVIAHPHDQGGVEEPVLDVWVQLYPRTSIDNSRRVRELSHNIQYELLKSARKRMEKHVPQIVGAWLAGLYDRDRVVARAASDGLSSFLNTPEKVNGFWKRCQAQIIDFAIGAIQETQDSLSDERSTTKEDAEAKYYRVVTASLSLVLGLLQRLSDEDIGKLRSRYDDYFAEENVWKSITFDDSSVRKSVCQLLVACLGRKLAYVESTKVKQAFITGGLKTNQANSALEYVIALTKLTQASPGVWAVSSSERKSPLTRLMAFIAKGSQGSPPKFWEYLDQLLTAIPAEDVTLDNASGLLTALKSGIANRDEPKTNTSYAWKCFIDTAKRLLSSLTAEDQLTFVQQHLFPLFEHFLFEVSDRPSTTIPTGLNAMAVFVDAYLAIVQASPAVVMASSGEWDRLAGIFSAKLAGSLPEVSKEYTSSQENIAEEGRRWFGLVGQIHAKVVELSEIPDHTDKPSAKILSQCVVLLESRNMKPFGAARVLEYALSTSPHLFSDEAGRRVADFLLTAGEEHVDKVIQSASSRYLLSCLRLLGGLSSQHQQYSKIWQTWVEAILELDDATIRDPALAGLISHDQAALFVKRNEKLQSTIAAQALATARSEASAWELFEAAVTYDVLTPEASQRLAREVVSLLGESQHAESALRALEVLANNKPEQFFQDESLHTALVAQLLSLSEIGSGANSSKAATIRSLLESRGNGKLPIVGIIQSNLERVGSQPLEIETLVRQAKEASSHDVALEDLFPSTNVWMSALLSIMERPVDPSLTITNILGGAAALVHAPAEANISHAQLPRDRKGRSMPARMALYTSHMFEADVELVKLPRQFQIELLYLQCLTIQLASDQLTTLSDGGLWKTLRTPEAIAEAENLVSSSRKFISDRATLSKWWDAEVTDEVSIAFRGLVDLLSEQSKDTTARALYSARALSEIIQSLAETRGASTVLEDRFMKTDVLKATPTTVFLASALLGGLGETLQPSKAASNFCNRLVSDIAGASPAAEKTPIILVLLTLSAQVYESGELPVANNRIVFAVRQITQWLDEPNALDPALSAHICRALAQLLPCMKDIYGSYWESTIEFCLGLWKKAGEHDLIEMLAPIHASLRLMKILESLSDPNDDLKEALAEFARAKYEALLVLLGLPRERQSQPLEIVDGILCREVGKMPIRYLDDLSDIYGLVASDSSDIQTAGFNLLHKAIPPQQEQKSVDAMLDKTDARLPDELLSLLLDAPTLERYSDEALAQFPSTVRCYLLSWKLVFDTFSTSSFKIRNDFTENLKTDNYLAPLLNFMFDVLGHSSARPLNLDKANLSSQHIRDYDVQLADAEPGEKSMQWLLVHLFYLVLKYIPGLFRLWYLDCRDKQTKIAVESWTTKFISPQIVLDALEEVQAWADSQEAPAGDEKELLVKVSRAAREVTAGYEIDESQASIVIKVPSSYPIDSVSVASVNRVAVTERKWQSWIMTTQGVITFSNGNIIDGLQVFKRNIIGALKGQSECAICYSIISADKRMPDKRCSTCNNLFHRTCLYKWFQTSNQNTCPLCRNPIDYLGADTAKRRQG
ncbi:hypothetical protein S40285_02894 [Stachybotrys chlorohalonatus IBT 40285]|uniref:E3 ubiquitin-protein ligase listerin n=1 Tax=Stachybotrys chlorohalonatus (strain IBT 40285) TaxID=1283841 RepID=A0A084QLN5_STAC4|nr:hypothetical protein S40285_02894 [Stachybotrys chlorohalonata IBT 40285]